jgi:uncharacterized OsmC-like protein
MNKHVTQLVKQRQDPLRARYRERPGEAQIVDHAKANSVGLYPFHGKVLVGDGQEAWKFGIHRAIGGDHDLPNPGDILCASLAACLDSTVRMLAGRMGVGLAGLEVSVHAVADVRGCLMVERGVPAGFQRIDVDVHFKPEDGTDPALVSNLAGLAEQCCVILQTLRSDIPVTTRFGQRTAIHAAAGRGDAAGAASH